MTQRMEVGLLSVVVAVVVERPLSQPDRLAVGVVGLAWLRADFLERRETFLDGGTLDVGNCLEVAIGDDDTAG